SHPQRPGQLHVHGTGGQVVLVSHRQLPRLGIGLQAALYGLQGLDPGNQVLVARVPRGIVDQVRSSLLWVVFEGPAPGFSWRSAPVLFKPRHRGADIVTIPTPHPMSIMARHLRPARSPRATYPPRPPPASKPPCTCRLQSAGSIPPEPTPAKTA